MSDTTDVSVTAQVDDPALVRRWLMLVAAVLPVLAMWSLANPMFASPDETAHIVRAQGFSNLDFSSPYRTDGPPIDSIECFRFQFEVTAACQDLTWGPDGTEIKVPTGDYPPLFHAIAAVPAVFSSGLFGAYLMRLWLAVICSAIIAWAGVLMTRPGSGPWQLTGVVLAVTPMVAFTAATVNPSGLASACAMLLIAGVLSVGRATEPPPVVALAAIAVGALGLALTRRDGLLWLAILVVVVVPMLPVRSFVTRIPRRTALIAGAVTVLVALVTLVWWAGPTVARFFRSRGQGHSGDWLNAARSVRIYLHHVVGTFGWLDSPVNDEIFLLAVGVIGFVVILGLSTGAARLVSSTALAFIALLVTPIAFGAVRFPYLQGRYLLPIYVALALVAAAAVASGDLTRRTAARASTLVLGAWVVIHFFAYLQNLRRYAVGRTGPWSFLSESEWSPPMMSNLVALGLFAVALGISTTALWRVRREVSGA